MKENYSKSYFCARYLSDNGVACDRYPVGYNVDREQGGKSTVILVNASWFTDWPSFHKQAEIALDAAAVEFDSFNSRYVKRGHTFPVSGAPQYLLEKNKLFEDTFDVWVNTLCPDEAEFQRVLSEARQRIENYKKPVAGMRIASFYESLPVLPIPSSEFQSVSGTIGAVWGK